MNKIRVFLVMTLALAMTIAFSTGVIFAVTDMPGTGSGWKAVVNVKDSSAKIKVDGGTYCARVVKVVADKDGIGMIKVKYNKGTNSTVSFAAGQSSTEFQAATGVKDIGKGKTASAKLNMSKDKEYYIAVYQEESLDKSAYKDKATIELTIAENKIARLNYNKTVTVVPNENFDYYRFKFKANCSGLAGIKPLLSVTDNAPKEGTVIGTMRLYQKGGKNKTAYRDVKYGKAVDFAVKNGKTYYIKFIPSKKYYEAYNVKLAGLKLSPGKTVKSKAKVLKSTPPDNSYSTYMLSGKKRTHWYKVEVTEGEHAFYLGRNMASDVTMTVYKGKKKIAMYNGVSKHLTAGTYYIKIRSKSTKTSGGYNLTYK